ncbi:MrcB family domain-containing protein [Dyadobacter sp. 3J3]|uniref:MrcB family domain-containing protein n=1 Tax=Dyadobacter sp. 3J3 TaxID=2606600 RepID=UPI00135CE210|nr:DUF3578 domain-containing protein [Dyadobacter sp. 3J3]
MGYFNELIKFLEQSKTDNLKYKHFETSYANLNVKVSFGQGGLARVSWISFLQDGQTTSNGIYPVYLYYKKQDLLILAYGISETHIPSINWELSNPKTISSYFKENNLGKPDRYGDSFVYKIYPHSENLSENIIDEDLENIVNIYKSALINDITPKNDKLNFNFDYKSFHESIQSANLTIEPRFVLRFIASLLTKPFVILTGLSGSGKTKLAQAFSKWICESEDQICIVAVGSDWTNRDSLLGYPNALESNTYVLPDNGVLDLIISAIDDPNKPYFLILDEMNLSHVERYFADFLSVMESDESILLRPEHSNKTERVPSKIRLPKNLFIIGTVNIDETTYMFSPKVLDRASVIEFRVNLEEMEFFLNVGSNLDLEIISSVGSNMAESFLSIARDKSLLISNKDLVNEALLKFFKELKLVGAEFGYRSASEILRLATIINKIEPEWTTNEIIDCAVVQKLLPKVHGSRRKLEPVLKALGKICLMEMDKVDEYISQDNFDYSAISHYPLTFEKISRMYKSLMENGFTSYAEA